MNNLKLSSNDQICKTANSQKCDLLDLIELQKSELTERKNEVKNELQYLNNRILQLNITINIINQF